MKAKRMASCAMTVALCVVLMLLGAVLELGMYAAPLFAGLCFIPTGQVYGRKYHILLYVAASILCLLLVPNVEQNMMFVCLFGWYPIARPYLQRLPVMFGFVLKLFVFNVSVVAIEWLIMTVLVPEVITDAMAWILLALGNVTFLAYDILIPKMEHLLSKITKLIK